MNAATVFSGFIANNSSFLSRQAFKMTNSVYKYDDCLQEFYCKVLEVLDKNPGYFTVTQPNAEAGLRTVIINFVNDNIRKAIVRNDTVHKTNLESTSESSDSVESEESSSVNTFDNYLSSSFENQLDTELYVESIVAELSRYEKSCPGIVDFFTELIDPSHETGVKYEAYRETLARPRVSGYIPMSILGKLLGYESNVTSKFEHKIKDVMSQVFGIDKTTLAL